MDLYLIAFVLGVAGLAVMAVGAAGHGHAGARGAVHQAGHEGGVHSGSHVGPHAGPHVGRADVHHGGGRDLALALASPRVLFAVLLGVGAAGLLLRPVVGGLTLALAALVAGVLFQRYAVAPVWRFVERFASTPARTLELSLYDHAHAASGFDARGEGLVALEVDGQVVQLLGRLRPEDRGVRVRAGDRLRVEAVDAERHRCTVSVAGPT